MNAVHRLARCPVALWQADTYGEQVKIVASREVTSECVERTVVGLRHSVIGRAMRERKLIQVPNVQVDSDFREGEARQGGQSMLVVPLLARPEEVVGVLTIYSLAEERFTNDSELHMFTSYKQELFATLASHAAIAIRNAHLFQDQTERTARLQWLQEVTTTISAGPSDLGKVLHLIVENLSSMFRTASCAIRLYNSGTDVFTPRVATGILTGIINSPPRPKGISRYVVRTKIPCYLEGDAVINPPGEAPTVRAEILEQDVKAVAVLPLISKGDVVGALYVTLADTYQFSQNDKQILKLFADQAAIAIENTKLLEELTTLNERLRRVSHEAIELIGAPTYVELSHRALDTISRTLKTEVSLYRCQENNPDMMKLEGCVPKDLESQLETTYPCDRNPFKSEMLAQGSSFLAMDCRSRGERLEGYVFVRRVGTVTQPAQPFDTSDNICLFLFADAIGHTIQKLRTDLTIRPLGDPGLQGG